MDFAALLYMNMSINYFFLLLLLFTAFSRPPYPEQLTGVLCRNTSSCYFTRSGTNNTELRAVIFAKGGSTKY